MNQIYELVASNCTQPLLKVIGSFSQSTDYNLSAHLFHLLLTIFVLSVLGIIYSCIRKCKSKINNSRLNKVAILGAILSSFYFWLSAASQNSVTPYVFPSYHRESLLLRSNAKDLVPEDFIVWRTERAIEDFIRDFDWDEYQRLSYEQILDDGQSQLIKIGQGLGYDEGLHTRKIKSLQGVPRLLGYSYGGPAYYDSFTHEIVIPDSNDYPASRYFFISTIIHELSHALYFQKELDATLIQYQAMLNSKYSTVRALANFLWLEYSPFIKHPQFYKNLIESGIDRRFVNEILSTRTKVRERMKDLFSVQTLKKLMRKINIQNQASKYGWQPEKYANSPFYKVVFNWEVDLWKANSVFQKQFTDKFNWSK